MNPNPAYEGRICLAFILISDQLCVHTALERETHLITHLGDTLVTGQEKSSTLE